MATTMTEARAQQVVVALAEAGRPLPAAEAAPGLSPDQAQRALALARKAGLVRPDVGGAVVLTGLGKAAAALLRGH